MKSIPVAIVPILNRFDLLDQLIESIDYPIDNLLIIDNSNTYKINPNLKINEILKNCKIHILNMPSNIGVSGSWNLGIKCFPHACYWLFMSNDNHWLPGSLSEMQLLSSADKLVMSNVAWNSFSLGSNIVKKIGLFDENYYPAYYEDTDYMERLRINGLLGNITWSSVPLKQIGMSLTVKNNPVFFEKNIFTNKENNNYRIKKIREDNIHLNCLQYDLQRRIDHEWFGV